MKNRFSSPIRSGVTQLFVLLILLLSFWNQLLLAQHPKTKFEIKETAETISITSKRYSLSIDKSNAVVNLKNWHGIAYSSFPLDVQFKLNETSDQIYYTRQWKTRDKSITMTARQHNLLTQEIMLSFDDEYFQIQLATKLPIAAETGIYLLRNAHQGFNRTNWEEYFSPEPDDYFKLNPAVDIRVDRDQQWAFAPAPLNLSFKTAAGWFSIGLVSLADASIYSFKDDALWLDYPWHKLHLLSDQLYKFPALIITFNNSPWDAVGDYSQALTSNKKNINPQLESDQRPVWWCHPLVSTWGEQRVKKITYDHPDFNSSWVKDYVAAQEQALESLRFNLIIENKWARADGDPFPSDRFHNLRNLIDWCHERGHKVILFWKAWKVEANSLPIKIDVFDGEYIDATHPLFESYVDSCCEIMLGNRAEGLNADGLKIDELFQVRDPATANYQNSQKGIGYKEVDHYLETFYKCAKSYKPDALIMSSAIDPHFSEVQDMVRINDDWDNKTRREKRARIITQALPGMLINSDAADLSAKIALYHYVTSAVYGVPSIQYLDRFQDAVIPQATKSQISKLLKFYELKPNGKLRFVDYGNWQILNKDDEVLAESIPSGKGFLLYHNNSEASFLCVEDSTLHLVFERHLLKTVQDEDGIKIPFMYLGHGLYELTEMKQGKTYKLGLKKISNKYR